MRNCSNCQVEALASDKFCFSCGQVLPAHFNSRSRHNGGSGEKTFTEKLIADNAQTFLNLITGFVLVVVAIIVISFFDRGGSLIFTLISITVVVGTYVGLSNTKCPSKYHE